jgi:hypothetical protein
LSFEKVKGGEDTDGWTDTYLSRVMQCMYRYAWNTKAIELARKMFMEQILVEAEVKQFQESNVGWKWQIPTLYFHDLKREMV